MEITRVTTLSIQALQIERIWSNQVIEMFAGKLLTWSVAVDIGTHRNSGRLISDGYVIKNYDFDNDHEVEIILILHDDYVNIGLL